MAELHITMARGDLAVRSFRIKNDTQEPYTEELDEIYISVKKNSKDKKLLFQKRLSENEIEYLNNGRYQFKILPEDTNGLDFDKDYEFDIELVKYDDQAHELELKRTFAGILTLTKEVTHVADEGARE